MADMTESDYRKTTRLEGSERPPRMPGPLIFAILAIAIGLGYLIPRILTIGDVGHWAACVAPRPLRVVNPVDGRRRPVSVDA